MIRSLTALLFSLCVAAHAGELVTATITVTNTPTDGDTITVNGSARTWKDSIATPSSEILIGGDAEESATNMFLQFAGAPFATLRVSQSGSDAVKLVGIVGQSISISIGGTWGEYTLSTNQTTNRVSIAVPASAWPTQADAESAFSQLAADMSDYSTESFAYDSVVMQHFASLVGSQTLSNKTLVAPAVSGATIDTSEVGATDLSVSGQADFYGGIAITNTTPEIRIYDSDETTDEKLWFIRSLGGTLTIELGEDDGGTSGVAMEISRTGGAVNAVSFGLNSLESGDFYSTGEIRLARAAHTTLADGNNAGVDFGTATFWKIKAGPTSSFAICGIAGGQDGRYLVLYNATGQNMTIANNSGVDPTAANRILTGTGSDIATTGNGIVTLIYDSEDSRWVVLSIRD